MQFAPHRLPAGEAHKGYSARKRESSLSAQISGRRDLSSH
jgi:hypothetical protein